MNKVQKQALVSAKKHNLIKHSNSPYRKLASNNLKIEIIKTLTKKDNLNHLFRRTPKFGLNGEITDASDAEKALTQRILELSNSENSKHCYTTTLLARLRYLTLFQGKLYLNDKKGSNAKLHTLFTKKIYNENQANLDTCVTIRKSIKNGRHSNYLPSFEKDLCADLKQLSRSRSKKPFAVYSVRWKKHPHASTLLIVRNKDGSPKAAIALDSNAWVGMDYKALFKKNHLAIPFIDASLGIQFDAYCGLHALNIMHSLIKTLNQDKTLQANLLNADYKSPSDCLSIKRTLLQATKAHLPQYFYEDSLKRKGKAEIEQYINCFKWTATRHLIAKLIGQIAHEYQFEQISHLLNKPNLRANAATIALTRATEKISTNVKKMDFYKESFEKKIKNMLKNKKAFPVLYYSKWFNQIKGFFDDLIIWLIYLKRQFL